jgi:glyoxylase-like metal-dependent hydrolase (beta-lactamase superfamily II)
MGDYSPPDEAATRQTRERVQKALDTGFRSDGAPVSEPMREYYHYILDNLDLMNAELGRVKIATPTKTMTDKMTIDLGGRKVELLHLGRGNTRGDVMMHLPAERIIATGDAVVRPTPFGFGSYPRSWAQVLREVKAMDPRIIVPGHGEIMNGDFAYIDLLIETFDLIADQAAAFAAQGKSLEEARAEMDFSSVEERFTGGDPLLAIFFNAWFKQPIAKAAYNDATGVENENPDEPLAP